MVVRPCRREIQEEVGENLILLEMVKNCTAVVWKRWTCNFVKKWLPSLASNGELSSLP